MNEYDREIARITRCDIKYEGSGDHYAYFDVDFRYEAAGQGFGRGIDMEFIIKFLKVCGKQTLRDCIGVCLWVTHDHSGIVKLEALRCDDHLKYRPALDILVWAEEAKQRSEREQCYQDTQYAVEYEHIDRTIREAKSKLKELYHELPTLAPNDTPRNRLGRASWKLKEVAEYIEEEANKLTHY